MKKQILFGGEQQAVQQVGDYRLFIEQMLAGRGWNGKVDWSLTGLPIAAQVSGGNWIGQCPSPTCGNYVVVDPQHPFFCTNCANARNDNRARAIIWPDNIKAIHNVLEQRINPNHRNWKPGETIEFLLEENRKLLEMDGIV